MPLRLTKIVDGKYLLSRGQLAQGAKGDRRRGPCGTIQVPSIADSPGLLPTKLPGEE
ncbi:MAG: hypothetical protein JRH20_23565 [Deltaproteobacteria bacterium]|nr:hypothetical protein [Deltaproteobacteria bacterium]